MEDEELNTRLRAICRRVYDVPQLKALAPTTTPPFDISRPNAHSTKREFLAESTMVDALISDIDRTISTMRKKGSKGEKGRTVLDDLGEFLDQFALSRLSTEKTSNPHDLVADSAARAGLTVSFVFLAFDMRAGLLKRKQELEAQKVKFWSEPGRPPDVYARVIALRFAKEVARHTGARPTFGTARDGDHPSTEFGRALEEIFSLLGIETNFRHPASWAIKQLTDDDMKPDSRNSMSGLFGIENSMDPNTFNALAAVMAKGESQ